MLSLKETEEYIIIIDKEYIRDISKWSVVTDTKDFDTEEML